MNDEYEQFRKIVDEKSELLDEKKQLDWGLLGEEYRIDNCNKGNKVHVIRYLQKALEKILLSKSDMKSDIITKLIKYSELNYIIHSTKLAPYYQILNIIKNEITPKKVDYIVGFGERKKWDKIIEICVLIYKIKPNSYEINFDEHCIDNPSIIASAKSAKYLVECGFEVIIVGETINLNKNIDRKIQKKISKYIDKLGALNVIKYFLEQMRIGKYNSTQKRYKTTRTLKAGIVSINECKNSLPINYFFNRCLKQIKSYGQVKYRTDKFRKLYDELFDLIRAYIGIRNLEEFSQMESIFLKRNELQEYLVKNTLYDQLYTFGRQCNPDYIVKMIPILYRSYFREENNLKRLRYNVNEFIYIAKFILKNKDINCVITLDEAEKELFNIVEKEKIIELLDMLSTNIENLNQDFVHFNDVGNFYEKPLIKLSSTKFLLIDASLSAYSFIEVLEEQLRGIEGSDFDVHLGKSVEEFIYHLLDEKKIEYKRGYYGKQNECDLVLESDSAIAFIEIKKKQLTYKSREGYDLDIINDIEKSLINSQIQLGKEEIEIISNSQMVLRDSQRKRDSNIIGKIEWKKRNIKRISLVKSDYGFTNYHSVTMQLLQLLSECKIELIDNDNKELCKKVAEIQKKIDDLQNQNKILIGKNYKNNIREVYFESYFRSLQQFMLALSDSSNSEELIKRLTLDENVSIGTSDYYAHYECMATKI